MLWAVLAAVFAVYLMIAAVVFVVSLIWPFLLAAALLWFLARVMIIGWQDCEARRRVEHRRRLAAIQQVKRSTVAAMVDEARKASR